MRSKLTPRLVPAVVLIALVAALLSTAVALAAQPIKGATYSGRIARTSNVVFAISFKVSANGKRVSGFSLPNGYPVYCQGGGFGGAHGGSAEVTRRGTFTVKLPIVFAPTHKREGFLVITGRFGSGGRESGKVKTNFSAAKVCNGSSGYTTTG